MVKFNKKLYIIAFIISYIVTFLVYYMVSKNLGNTPLFLQMRRFIPAALSFSLPFLIINKKHLTTFIFSIFTSLLCSFTSPILFYLTYRDTATYISLPYDFAFGLYLFPILVFSTILLNNFIHQKKSIINIFITFLHLFFLIPPLFQIFYFLKFSHCLTEKGTMAIYQTNITEAVEYLSSVGFLFPLFIIFIIGLFYINYYYVKKADKFISNYIFSNKNIVIILTLVITLSSYLYINLCPKTYFYELSISTYEYFESIKLYRDGRDKILKTLTVKNNNQTSSPHTIILVIGESATRNYMSAFSQLTDNTTPWLKSQKNNPNFILFNNAYACDYGTAPALSKALTESSYYNQKLFYESISFIDIAKKAGYDTYWFSNQGIIGSADTPITLVAETASTEKWTSQDHNITTQYDEALLSYLKTVNPNKNNLIVLHMMGSHIDYNNRYPRAFQKWTDPGETGRLADYKNSLLYTDHILKSIFEYSMQNLNLDALIYFSDHGNDPNRSRNPDSTKFINLRIPMFIYYSNNYKTNNYQIINNLINNKDKFFSNDLIFDLMCGILNIESNHYNETQSLTSDKYMYTDENLLSGSGLKKAKDDPYISNH